MVCTGNKFYVPGITLGENIWRKKENLMESDERILQHDDFAEIMKNYTG